MLSFLRHVLRGFSVVTLSVLLLPATVFTCILGGFIFLPLPANLPEPKPIVSSEASKIYDVNGAELATLRKFDQNLPVEQKDIPPVLKQALISMEDKNFYNHKGVDLRGSLRALKADLQNKSVAQGGSTITQQYVKNAYTNKERTLSRKLREAVLASQLDRQVPKDEILFKYLSSVYFGNGAYGIGAAAQTYFRVPVSQLNASQSAVLVALIPAPSQWSPRDNPTQNESRRKLVLSKMLEQRYLTQQQYDEAVQQVVWLESQGTPTGPATIVYNDQKEPVTYPYFVDYVQKYLINQYGEDVVIRGGLRVQTTIDPVLQKEAEESVAKTLNGTKPPLNMALVSVEPPTGYVRAFVGGRDFKVNQVNLALGGCPPTTNQQTKKPLTIQVKATCMEKPTMVNNGGTGRQPGSSFKPFVLATAYEEGIPPTKVYPAPNVYVAPGCKGSTCAIRNSEGESFGPTNLKEAMVHSINTVYAPLVRDVGHTQTAEMAKKLGITSAYYSQEFHQTSGTYALGVIDVSPLDMASAYSVFANRGLRQPVTPVVKVVDTKGKVWEDNTNREPKRVIDEAVADNVTDALKGVIDRGTAANTGKIGRPAAGKTGTTEDFGDAWFVGYTPTLSTAVWMGYSDGVRTINYKGNTRVYGGTYPTATWANFMKQALADVPITEFSQPAPIKKPEADVLEKAVGVSVPTAFAPATERKPDSTPAGDYDRVDSSPPPVAAPTTLPPSTVAPTTAAPTTTAKPTTTAPPTTRNSGPRR